MGRGLRIVHYLNQFFGGIGGEDRAGTGPEIKIGPVGPGIAMQNALKERGEIVATVICGDNYFSERIDEAAQEVIQLLTPYQPDAAIAGPAFNAGRYGVACGAVCKAVQEKLGIPAVTGMYEDNPGVDLYRKHLYIVKTADSARGMTEIVSKMVNLAYKLASGQEIGIPSEEGYIPRGILKEEFSDRTGAERAVDMLLAKLQGKPFETELHPTRFDRVRPAPPLKDLSSSKIAIVTDGGLVPRGNPDNIEVVGATKYGKYAIEGTDRLSPEDYEVVHAGYDNSLVNEDPHRLVPLDAMRAFEKEAVIGKVSESFYSTAGIATTLEISRKMGQDIAEQLKAEGVDGAILTSTWGTSTRCGAVIVKELERAGTPVAHICSMTPVALMVGSNRIIPGTGIVQPVGNADLDPKAEKALRRAIVERAFEALQTELTEQKVFPQPA